MVGFAFPPRKLETTSLKTLPDHLEHGLDVVFVGINPGAYSAEVGHYFATPQNRFWPAVNRSGLLAGPLDASTDHLAVAQRIGFTDLVKRPSNSASKLRVGDYRKWAPVLKEKLLEYAPLIVCFQGVTAYRNYLRHAEEIEAQPELGLQPDKIGESAVFVVPNPSPANASYSLDILVEWYRRLADLRTELKRR